MEYVDVRPHTSECIAQVSNNRGGCTYVHIRVCMCIYAHASENLGDVSKNTETYMCMQDMCLLPHLVFRFQVDHAWQYACLELAQRHTQCSRKVFILYVCMYACMHVYTCTCKHTHTCKGTQAGFAQTYAQSVKKGVHPVCIMYVYIIHTSTYTCQCKPVVRNRLTDKPFHQLNKLFFLVRM
jgi:hypothetical protein